MPRGVKLRMLLQSINSELGQALESIVPKAFLNQEVDVDTIKKG